MKKKNIRDESLLKEIGRRFKEFRKFIKKSQTELGDEFMVLKSTIFNIEKGKCFPLIKYQHYLNKKYHLNINWLLTGKEDMILKPEQYLKDTDLSKLFNYIDADDPRFEQYEELKKLLQIPTINLLIFAKLEILKKIAEEEINEFFESNHVDQ